MEIAKALILAAGDHSERPWPAAPAGPRQLFPIGNRPILVHHLEALRAAGVLEAKIFAGGAEGAAIRSAVGDGRAWGLTVHHEEWDSGAGIGGALVLGRDFVADEPVLVQEGGAILRDRMHAHIAAFARERLDALALRIPARAPLAARAPGYLLSPLAVSILADGPEAAANPVAGVRANGGRVRVQAVDGCLPCRGDLDGLLESNRCVLDRLEAAATPASLSDATLQGTVNVHPTARVERSTIRGPVVIGPGARVSNAYIGPYTSIGAGVVVEGAELEHSIVLDEAEIRFVGTRLESSVIGRGARVMREFSLPAAMRMSLGDGAEIVLR